MVKDVIQDKDQILRQVSIPVKAEEITSREIDQLLTDLKETLNTFQYGVAISAIQIGVPKRIFLIQRTRKDGSREEPQYLINPEIVNTSEKEVKLYEACLSVNFSKTFGEVTRKSWVRIKYLDEKGEEYTKKFDGLDARIILHEIAHLNGKLFTDIVDKKTLMTLKEYLEFIKTNRK